MFVSAWILIHECDIFQYPVCEVWPELNQGYWEKSCPDDEKTKMSENADIILCAAKAGKEALLKKHFSSAKNLKVVSDVNVVPPPGVEGLEVNSNGDTIKGTKVYGIGALAVGQIKSQVQHKLLKLMCESDKPVFLDFREAFKIAEQLKK